MNNNRLQKQRFCHNATDANWRNTPIRAKDRISHLLSVPENVAMFGLTPSTFFRNPEMAYMRFVIILIGLLLVVGCVNKSDADRRKTTEVDVIVESPIMLNMAALTGAGSLCEQYVNVKILNSDDSSKVQQGRMILKKGMSYENIAWLEEDTLWYPLGSELRLTLRPSKKEEYPDISIEDCLKIEKLSEEARTPEGEPKEGVNPNTATKITKQNEQQ